MPNASAPTYGEKKLLILVKNAELRVDGIANKLLADKDLTNAQLKILVILFKSNEGLRQIDIERHFNLTNPTVTGIINTMEKKGLVERVKNPNDGRSKIIIPTQAARDSQDEYLALYEELEKQFVENLEYAERKELARLLNKLLGN